MNFIKNEKGIALGEIVILIGFSITCFYSLYFFKRTSSTYDQENESKITLKKYQNRLAIEIGQDIRCEFLKGKALGDQVSFNLQDSAQPVSRGVRLNEKGILVKSFAIKSLNKEGLKVGEKAEDYNRFNALADVELILSVEETERVFNFYKEVKVKNGIIRGCAYDFYSNESLDQICQFVSRGDIKECSQLYESAYLQVASDLCRDLGGAFRERKCLDLYRFITNCKGGLSAIGINEAGGFVCK